MLPFKQVAMDLITGLLKHKGKDAILTIVNHGCSQAAVFLPCVTTITGLGIAQLYMDHIYKWFGLPTKVISDRDPQFTSHFGKGLAQRLKINQNLSSAFHPQTDGISERKNQWVEQYLRLVTCHCRYGRDTRVLHLVPLHLVRQSQGPLLWANAGL
jgi:transposase InsO family protein